MGNFTWSKSGPESGKSYEGEYKNNQRHGKGKMIYEPDPKTGFEGSVDEGSWIKNKQVIEEFEKGEKKYSNKNLKMDEDEDLFLK